MGKTPKLRSLWRFTRLWRRTGTEESGLRCPPLLPTETKQAELMNPGRSLQVLRQTSKDRDTKQTRLSQNRPVWDQRPTGSQEPDLNAAGADEPMGIRCVSRAGAHGGVLEGLGWETDNTQKVKGGETPGKQRCVWVCVYFMMMIMVHQAVLVSHTHLFSPVQRPVCRVCYQPSHQWAGVFTFI